MRRNLVSNHADLDVVAVRQTQVLLRRDVAEHGGASLRNDGRTDSRGDVVIARRDIGCQRAEGVERSFLTPLLFPLHVVGNLVHRDVARAFNHDLTAAGLSNLGQLAEGAQLSQLGFIVSVGNGARTQAITEGERDIVLRQNVAQLSEAGVEEALLVMREAPCGHNRTTAGNNARHAIGGQRHVAQQHTRVNGHVVHALFTLLNDGFAVDFPGQLGRVTLDLLQRLVNRHRTNRHRGVTQNPLTGFVNVLASGQVHDRVRAPTSCPHHLLHLFRDGRSHGRIADICVDLGGKTLADNHRLSLRVLVVRRNHGTTRSDLFAHNFRIHTFTSSNESHLRSDNSRARPSQLGLDLRSLLRTRNRWHRRSLRPRVTSLSQTLLQVQLRVFLGVDTRGVVRIEVSTVRQIDPTNWNPQVRLTEIVAERNLVVMLVAAVNRASCNLALFRRSGYRYTCGHEATHPFPTLVLPRFRFVRSTLDP